MHSVVGVTKPVLKSFTKTQGWARSELCTTLKGQLAPVAPDRSQMENSRVSSSAADLETQLLADMF